MTSREETLECNCSICLSTIKDAAMPVSKKCSHKFCFTCLAEWAHAKPKCPNCKQSFSFIRHNIQAKDRFEEYNVNTGENEIIEPPVQPIPPRSEIAFRTYIYKNNHWVQRVESVVEFSPAYLKANKAVTNRLIPWINREVLAFNRKGEAEHFRGLIIPWLEKYALDHEDFFLQIYPITQQHTLHFIHELGNFIRSSLTFKEYDVQAVYPTIANTVANACEGDGAGCAGGGTGKTSAKGGQKKNTAAAPAPSETTTSTFTSGRFYKK